MDIRYINNSLFQTWITDWYCYLDTVINISCHPVCGGDINLRIAIIVGDHHARVLKKAVNNTDDANIVADPSMPGTNEHMPRMIMFIFTPEVLAP